MLKLYDYFRSSAAYRVRIALNLKGISYHAIPVHLINNGGEQHSPNYQTLNPQQLVPTFVDGHKVLTQSLAIIEYINEIHPDTPLLPADPYQKALTRAFAFAIAADTHPINNMRVLNYLKNEFHISDQQKSEWIQHWISNTFTALEAQLTARKYNGGFCFSDQPTIADIFLVPQMYNARRFDCDLSNYPALVAIDAECQKLDAFTKAIPKEPVT